MSSSKISEQSFQTVYRDSDGRRITRSQYIAQKAKEGKVKTPEEKEKETFDWNIATASKRQVVKRTSELKDIKLLDIGLDKPIPVITRSADDEKMNRMQKEELRRDDPMYAYFMQKRLDEEEEENQRRLKENPDEGMKPTTEDFTKESRKPIYRGAIPISRFNIRPGYRWDGIKRGTQYEEKRLQRANITTMRNKQAYQWSVANL